MTPITISQTTVQTGAELDALESAAAQLADLLESVGDAVIALALDGTVLAWNPAARDIFGYDAAEIVGTPVYRLIPPHLHEEQEQQLSSVARGERVGRHEAARLHRAGHAFLAEAMLIPLRDRSGVVVGASAIERNISERRDAAEAGSRLAAIVESSDDAIVGKTVDGIVISWNAAAERMYGYPAAEMLGEPIYRVVPKELQDEERHILERVSRGEHVAHYETIRRRKDGELIDISLTISPVRDTSGNIVALSSIKRDITDRKRNEAALRQAAKLEAIGRLAAGLAHDFNNQLHAVSGFANFVASDAGLSPAARQDVLQIQKAAERMASLTRHLLAFARQQVMSPETLDLNAMVADAHSMLHRLIGVDLDLQVSFGRGPKWVRVDRAQLVQVLMNLVINARDALQRGGRIFIRTDTLELGPGQLSDRIGSPIESGAYAELVVQDTGLGIAPEHLSRIFEPFFTTKEVGRGTGLGLATVEGIVSQSGGHILVESELQRGTTVRILLPLTGPPEAASGSGTGGMATRPHPRKRILVVDDEDLVRTVIARTLQDAGYEIVKARDGAEALDCLDQVGGSVDLVIADIVMPVVGGPELGEEMERRYPRIPVIWMSGHSPDAAAWLSEDRQGQPFLQKPISGDLLLATVGQLIEHQSRGR